MAAGMGSRYGGLKQIDAVGPNGEFLIDYSAYDAIAAGFDKIVFVIRQDFAAAFEAHFAAAWLPANVEIKYVYQDLNDLPAGLTAPKERAKPWGTGHAVWSARNVINEPFAVISADDFYGRHAYQTVASFLDQLSPTSQHHYAVVGYRLGNTLSANGWVARGLLKEDAHHHLTSIHEHTKIGFVDGQIVSRDKNGFDHQLSPDRLVSMVMFAFTPDIFAALQTALATFVNEYASDLSREFFTPNVVNDLIQAGQATMTVLPTESSWFGVTYHEDRKATVEAIAKLTAQKIYPAPLWAKS